MLKLFTFTKREIKILSSTKPITMFYNTAKNFAKIPAKRLTNFINHWIRKEHIGLSEGHSF